MSRTWLIRAVALVVAVNAGCDGYFVQPAAPATGLVLGYSLVTASPAGAFDKADNVRVRVDIIGGESIDRIVDFPPGQDEVRIRIELHLSQETANASVAIELRKGTQVLFTGAKTVALKEGQQHEAEVPLTAVAAQLSVASGSTINVLNTPIQLTAVALFATGDTIGSTGLTWSTSATDIQLTPQGRLTALQNGTYSVTVTSGSLTGTMQVVVTAPAAAASFTSNTVVANFPGEIVTPPSVRVTDVSGTGLRGVTVTFSANNGGTVSTATAITNAQGLASAGNWTLGSSGVNTLTATVTGLAPVVLNVTPLDPCTRALTTTLPSTNSGVLTPGRDCRISQRAADIYAVTMTTGGVLKVQESSTVFSPLLWLGRGPSLSSIIGFGVNGQSNSTLEYVVPAGTYWIAASTTDSAQIGAYTLTFSTLTEPVSSCVRDAIVFFGAVAQGRITAADCVDPVSPDAGTVTRRYDGYTIQLFPSETITVNLVADFPSRFTYWLGNTLVQGHLGTPSGQSRSFTVTAGANGGFYRFYVLADQHNGSGNYAMSFTGTPNPSTAHKPITNVVEYR